MSFRYSLLVLIIAISGCLRKDPVSPERLEVLEHLYATTKEYYANFERRPDFDSAYQAALSQLSPQMTDAEFFDLCSRLLGSLQDPHIRLAAPFETFYTFDLLGYERNVDLETIKDKYLEPSFIENSRVLYGIIGQNIGYLYLPDFTDWTTYGKLPAETKAAIDALKETNGLIIDLRNNDGGSAIYAQALAALFTQQRFFWHQSINKTGPEPNDFDQPYNWYVSPSSDYFYNKPVVVLTSRFTVSAGERFILAMKELQNVSVIGQRTAGTQGSVMGLEMLNGWWFTLTFEKILDASGENWDYVGIPPDIEINTTADQFPEDEDPLLERALEEVNR